VSEQIAHANGIDLAYDTYGDATDPTLLLIMGLAVQMVGWDPEFCGMLAERGFHVVRFDNRDVGLSSKIRGGPKPNVVSAALGAKPRASYLLSDMAADAAGLLDHLGVGAAHVVGASMGGMIAQTLAVEHPERVLSLCSIMSTTGERRYNRPRLRVYASLLRRPPSDRQGYVRQWLWLWRLIGSPGFPFDERRIRRLAEQSFDRCHYPAGVARQLLAIMASADRTAALGSVRVPTAVIHGRDDPLVRLPAGEATARAIPGAELIVIDGMGHGLPREVWPRVVDAIERNARRADAAPARSAA
jgi:pimeloyl-ACP methyl ester carboxylesterase